MIVVVPLYFVVRSRYWILAAVLVIAALVQLLAALNVAREATGAIAVIVYGLLAAHAMDVSRRKHPRAAHQDK